MLIELRVQNFAVIRDLVVRPGPGLTVLSGETGAGKSVIVDALSLLVGERASADLVRDGEDRAVVEGVFELPDGSEIPAILAEQGIEPEDGLVILRREVAATGRSRAWVNGSPATAGLVGQLGRRLVDLHGQHEHQTLLRAEEQRAILDAYAGAAALAAETEAAYRTLQRARAELDALDRRRQDIEQRLDFLRHQAEEIEKARLEPDELERLEAEARRLEHAEDLARLSARLHHELYAAETSVTARLDDLRRALDHLIRIDPSQAELTALLDEAYYGLEELGRRMGDYAATIEHDPARLEAVRRRQDLIFRLCSKYGPTVEDVIETGKRARAELDTLDTAALDRRRLERDVAEAEHRLQELARELSARRAEAARRLEDEIMQILPELGLGGRFVVALTPANEVGPHGAEDVEFQIALNIGFEPRPLARVASGGELSRIMLALKTVLARLDSVPTLVFDEIDTGIGGRVGHQVAERLRDVARHHQVFVITHLAQIAARADQHFLVVKQEENGEVVTRLEKLDEERRVAEIARMMGGDAESTASLEHARQLLGLAAAGN